MIMRFSGFVVAVALAAQVGCTLGAPAMNDSIGSSVVVPQISVARRTSLPVCTPARDDIQAYVRDERLFATCDGADWRGPDGNVVTANTDAGARETVPSVEPSAENGGTVDQL